MYTRHRHYCVRVYLLVCLFIMPSHACKNCMHVACSFCSFYRFIIFCSQSSFCRLLYHMLTHKHFKANLSPERLLGSWVPRVCACDRTDVCKRLEAYRPAYISCNIIIIVLSPLLLPKYGTTTYIIPIAILLLVSLIHVLLFLPISTIESGVS